jgi:hypothetical protein
MQEVRLVADDGDRHTRREGIKLVGEVLTWIGVGVAAFVAFSL